MIRQLIRPGGEGAGRGLGAQHLAAGIVEQGLGEALAVRGAGGAEGGRGQGQARAARLVTLAVLAGGLGEEADELGVGLALEWVVGMRQRDGRAAHHPAM